MTKPWSDEELASRLAAATRFGRLVHVAECASTQDLAAQDPGTQGPPPEAVYWADHQTRGRGRQRREWHDEAGVDLAVSFSIGQELPRPLALAAALPLAVLAAVEPLLGRRAQLKWPNDVLLDGQKLSGVLIDAGIGGRDGYAVGIGINVNRTRFPRELEGRSTSLALATGREHDRRALLLDLAQRLDEILAALAANDVADLERRFADRLGLLGREVDVVAGRSHRGVLRRIDFDHLELADGTRLPLGQVTAIALRVVG